MFKEQSIKQERAKLLNSITIPLSLLVIMWLLHLLQYFAGWELGFLGIRPTEWWGLRGIIFSPLLHGDFAHLTNNSISFAILATATFYFYRGLGLKVLTWIWLLGGLLTWVIGRDSYHIGASSLIYGLAAFLLLSGIIRKNLKLMALSLFVVFVYGYFVWGVLPDIQYLNGGRSISWEGHLAGSLAGLFCAVYYRKLGPQKEFYEWEEEEDLPDENNPQTNTDLMIHYHFKNSKES